MAEVHREVRLEAPAEQVWALIGPFDGLADWHPAVLSCDPVEEDGLLLRRVKVVGNIRLLERLLVHDDGRRVCRTAIEDGALPMAGHAATLSVREAGPRRCVVAWSASFEPAGAPEDVAREALEGILDAGLNALAIRFGRAP